MNQLPCDLFSAPPRLFARVKMTGKSQMQHRVHLLFVSLHVMTQHNTWWREEGGCVTQMRVRQGTTMLPGPQPSPCPETRLACYLKPSCVRKGVGGGKPPCRSQILVTLEEEGRGVEERSKYWYCCVINGLGCKASALFLKACCTTHSSSVHTSDSQSG